MRTNVELDNDLLNRAMELTQITTKKAVIQKALEELVKTNTRKDILSFINSDIWEENLKEMRTLR